MKNKVSYDQPWWHTVDTIGKSGRTAGHPCYDAEI